MEVETTRIGRVLIADDDPVIHAELRGMLCGTGGLMPNLEVDSAFQGDQAVRLVEQALRDQRPYSLAFIDVHMPPGIDGLEATSRFWQFDSSIQTVLCSSSSDEKLEATVSSLGTNDRLLLLRKPIDGDVLRQMARTLLSKWELGRQVRRQFGELAREARRTRMVVETASDAYLLLDSVGLIADWSEQAVAMFGWPKSDLLGRRADTILILNSRDFARLDDLLVSLAPSNSGTRIEMIARRNGSGDLPVEVSIAPMRADGILSFNVFVHDVSPRRRLHAQLIHADKMRSIGHLAAGIAHEINTPVQFVGDNARFLREAYGDLVDSLRSHEQLVEAVRSGSDPSKWIAEWDAARSKTDIAYFLAEVPQAIQESLDAIERVANIVRAMNSFAQASAVDKLPTDLHVVIENTLTICSSEWQTVAEVVSEFSPHLPLTPCVPGTIHQALLNILVNAAQSIAEQVRHDSGGKGRITISTRYRDGCAEIHVHDTGVGIAPENRDKIFDAFFTTKPVGCGIGQGLTIAHSIVVEGHQGEILVESQVGRGTTFIIRLPLDSSLTKLALESDTSLMFPTSGVIGQQSQLA